MSDEPDLTVRERSGSRQPDGTAPMSDGQRTTLFAALRGWTRYEVGELLGEGGMGQVFKAFDPVLKRSVALKVLQRQDPDLLHRFRQEAQTQARVEHPNVCKVYEVGEADGLPYIAMQLVSGQTLDRVATALPLEQRVLLMQRVAEAVHAAHQLGLIHRDIKPSNILVEEVAGQGLVPFVTDFGLARETSAPHLTQLGVIAGTPQYMSPEQARGGEAPLDRRSDVYSLGATLYELLAGRPPFTGASAVEVLLNVLEAEPERPRALATAIPEDLETIVLKCMEKDPARRYESARAVAEELRRFLAGDPILARPASFAYRIGKKAKKNKLLTAVIVVSCLTIATLLGLWGAAWSRSAERARLARRFGQETERAAAALRYAAMMPLHDIRPELRRVEETLARVDTEAAALGRVATGVGDSAIGRALVALQRPRDARLRLERAWAAGHHEPETAYALGQALGMIYSEELELAQRTSSEELRTARIAAVERDLLQPALAFLRQSDGVSLEAPAYARGLVALYEGDVEQAVAAAREAEQQVPWLYEAPVLAGDARCQEAKQLQFRGEHERALAALTACGEDYERAAALARSAPEVYAKLAKRWMMELEVVTAQGRAADAELAAVLHWSAQALTADPGSAEALVVVAQTQWRVAESLQRTGGDPSPALAASIAASQQILADHPSDANAHLHLGVALSRAAEVAVARGQDPLPDYAQAVVHLTRGLEAEPDQPFILNNLGLTYWRRGQYRLGLGQDPTADLDLAADTYRRAASVILAPTLSLNRGNVYFTRATYEQERGQDPTATLELTVAAYQEALAGNPREAVGWGNLASAQFLLAERRYENDGDPLPLLAAAASSCARAVELNPKYAMAFNNLATVHLLAGDYRAAVLDQDPAPTWAEARAAMQRARDLKPEAAPYARGLAEVELRFAVHALRSGGDPGPSLAAAGPLAEEACALNPKRPDMWSTLAEYHLVRARHLAATGRPVLAAVAAGLAATAEGQAINSDLAPTAAHRAFLVALAAAAEPAPDKRARLTHQGCEELTRARALHPDRATRRELEECAAALGAACVDAES